MTGSNVQQVQGQAIGQQMVTARCLRDSAHSPLTDKAKTTADVEALDQPATREWIAGRVATLLTHFYVAPLGQAQMKAIAADWHEVLCEFPEWAIQQACIDWLSGEIGNGKKPSPADIATRARWHYSIVPFMRGRLKREQRGAA